MINNIKNNKMNYIIIVFMLIVLIYVILVCVVYCAKNNIRKDYVLEQEIISVTTDIRDINQRNFFNRISNGNFQVSEEFSEEFSIGAEINSYSIPFYSKTPESAILRYMKKIKSTHFKTDHLMFISLLADANQAKMLFKINPDFSDYRIFDWLLYELLFDSSFKKTMILDALINFYSYSHCHFLMDLLLLKHFYLQLETYVSTQYQNKEKHFTNEIINLINNYNKIMFNNFSRFICDEYCQNLSIFNPYNIVRINKIKSIIDNMYSTVYDEPDREKIQKIIDDSSKLNILSMSDNIQLYSYCTLFYHFILKKQCYIDAINSLYNKISPTQETIYYKYEIYNSEFVFFIVVSPQVHSLPSQ